MKINLGGGKSIEIESTGFGVVLKLYMLGAFMGSSVLNKGQCEEIKNAINQALAAS